MNAPQAFTLQQKPAFPRVLVSTRALFKEEDILVLKVRERTLSRGCFLVNFNQTRETLVYRLIKALVLRAPRVIAADELIDAVWMNDVDGGPLAANQAILTALTIIRKRKLVEVLGLEITTAYGRGYALNELADVQVMA